MKLNVVLHWAMFLFIIMTTSRDAEYEMDFETNAIRIKTIRDIKKGRRFLSITMAPGMMRRPYGSILQKRLNNYYFFERLSTGAYLKVMRNP